MIRCTKVLAIVLLCVGLSAQGQSPAPSSNTAASTTKTKHRSKSQEQILLEQLNQKFGQLEDLTEKYNQLQQEMDEIKKQLAARDTELQQARCRRVRLPFKPGSRRMWPEWWSAARRVKTSRSIRSAMRCRPIHKPRHRLPARSKGRR
jgi:septal ring factor EnvC (AmiA/AmiB activator)